MMFAIAAMPYELAMGDEMSSRQFYANTQRLAAALEAAREDAERWRYIRRKLCLTGNGDGTCAMQAINLPAAIQGLPEPGQVAEFCDAAIDAALRERLAETANDLTRCPNCGGPADNGHDREVPPNPYWCSKCTES